MLIRLVRGLMLLLMIGLLPTAAAGHVLDLRAWISLEGDEVAIRLRDPYGALVEGGTGFISPLDRPDGTHVPLSETQPGTYRGSVSSLVAEEPRDLVVEMEVVQDRFKILVPGVRAGEVRAEEPVGLVLVEPPPKFPWGTILYGLAAALLAAATVAALRRRRQAAAEEGSSS